MGLWINCLGVITTVLVLNFPTFEGFRQGAKFELSPASAQDISSSQSHSQSEIDRLLKEGEEYYKNWEYDKALKAFQQVLKLRQEMGDLAAEGRALFYVGVVYEKLGEGENVKNYYWEVLAVAEEISNPSEAETVRKYLCRSEVGLDFLAKDESFKAQKLDIFKYCQENSYTESGSVTLLFDEDSKK